MSVPRSLARSLPPWWLFLVTGISWMLVALIVLRFDYLTVNAIAILFGIVAIGAGLVELEVTVIATGWRKLLSALLTVVFLATGIISFIHPGNSFVALAAVISFFLVLAGTFDIVSAIASHREAPFWWLQLVSGIAQLLIGFWAAGSWDVSVVVLVAWVAAIAIMRGIRDITLAFHLREAQMA